MTSTGGLVTQHKTEFRPGLNVALFLLCVVLVFLLRSLWTYPTEHGDAILKYYFAAEILRTDDWSLLLRDHHTLRWATVLPQIALTWMLGIRYELFFILPLLLFSIYLVFSIFTLKSVLNFSQLMLLGAILFVDPWSVDTSNQLINPAVGFLFSFAGIVVLVTQTKWRNLAVVFAAVLFFVAYGAHVTYLSFAAGGFLWLAFFRRQWSEAFILCGTLIVLIVLEVIIFNYLSDWQLTLGRLELLAGGSHVEMVTTKLAPVAPTRLLSRWSRLHAPELALCLVFFAFGPWLVWQKIKGQKIPEIIECTYMVGLCFALSITFAIASLNPIRTLMPLNPRYLVPFLPFASIIAVYAWSVLVAKVPVKNRSGKEFLVNLLIVSGLLIAFSMVFQGRYQGMIWKADREYTAYAEKFQRGELILTGKRRAVHSYIARYKNPVKIIRGKSGISVVDPSPQALCVFRLDKAPLQLNYYACKP